MNFEQIKQKAVSEWEAQKADGSAPSADGGAENNILDISEIPSLQGQGRTLLRNFGKISPESVQSYIAAGGYEGLAAALTLSGDDVISKVESASLRGCGGAGFSTAEKLKVCRSAEAEEKVIVCNASEGDPSATKDKCLLETDPHSVLEGLLIAAYAVGAGKAIISVNPEYTQAMERLGKALSQMTDLGLLGESILDSGFGLQVEIQSGQGLFVCGEESALLSALEGKLARSKERPPYPAVKGLSGNPTLVSNVETLANIAAIMGGNPPEKPVKLLTLAGGMKRSGVVEVPMDMTLRQLVTEIGGGTEDGKEIKAVQIGGPTGAWLTPDQLDVALDYDALAAAGTIMGSGSVLVAAENRCAVEMAKSGLDYIHLECCGKCVFGREGTRQLADILKDIAKGSGKKTDIALLEELGEAMKLGALCQLGKGAPNPVLSTIKSFRSEYEAHINNKTCPASVCK
jgi:NADH:ubiquinone oxidoreductase subunit F (NADH-binding)